MYDIDFTNNFQKIPPPRLRNDITTFFPLFFSFLDKMTHSLKYVQHWSPKKNLTVSQNLQIYISRSLVANILFAVHEKPLLTVFSLFFFFTNQLIFLPEMHFKCEIFNGHSQNASPSCLVEIYSE